MTIAALIYGARQRVSFTAANPACADKAVNILKCRLARVGFIALNLLAFPAQIRPLEILGGS